MNPIPKTHKKGTPLAFQLMERLTNVSYITLFTIWTSMAILFAGVYLLLGSVHGGIHGPSDFIDMDTWTRVGNALYYSIITATSTGYGDITPHGFSKAVAALQSMSALFIFALFVTKLVSHQQELTLNEVHRMAFEDVYHNTREGMFIVRKDFDHIIKAIRSNGVLNQENWENITIAYKQLQTHFEEIPDFYENEIHRYTIDEKRENLLLEGVHRTLHRINQMLDLMSKHDIDWISHERSMHELGKVISVVSSITPLWEERSPYSSAESFEDILQMKERMHLKILKSIE